MRWKTHRHEGSHFRFRQVLLESLVSKDQGARVPLSLYVTVCQVFTTWACAAGFIQTEPGNSPTHYGIGAWLKAGLTNAVSKRGWLICGTAGNLLLLCHLHTHLVIMLFANNIYSTGQTKKKKMKGHHSMLKQKVVAEKLLENWKMVNKMYLLITDKTRVRLRQWQDTLWDITTETTVILRRNLHYYLNLNYFLSVSTRDAKCTSFRGWVCWHNTCTKSRMMPLMLTSSPVGSTGFLSVKKVTVPTLNCTQQVLWFWLF